MMGRSSGLGPSLYMICNGSQELRFAPYCTKFTSEISAWNTTWPRVGGQERFPRKIQVVHATASNFWRTTLKDIQVLSMLGQDSGAKYGLKFLAHHA